MTILELFLTSDGLLPSLESFDREALLAVNGSDSLYLDRVAHVLTTAFTWVPLYISLFYIVLKNNDTVRKVLFILACVGLCLLLAGTVDDTIVKPMVGRWRPTHDPVIGTMVDVVDGYRGGRYGFFSAHASNTFSIAVTNCWTRMYLGVHFPGDILVGLTWGGIVGTSVYYLHYRVSHRMSNGYHHVSTHFTSTGYERSDANIPIAVLVFTLLYALLKSCIL